MSVVLVTWPLFCDPPEVISREVPDGRPAGSAQASPDDTGRAGETLAMLQKAEERLLDAEQSPMVGELFALGRMHHSAGRYPDAIDRYRRAIELVGDEIAALDALAEEGEEEVDAPIECVSDLSPGTVERAIDSARAILEKGNRSLALSCYRNALAPIAVVQKHRAEAWGEIESPLAALDSIESAVAIAPRDPELLFLYGAIAFDMEPELLELSRAMKARDAWQRYLRLAPKEPLAAHVQRALVHVDQLIEHGVFRP